MSSNTFKCGTITIVGNAKSDTHQESTTNAASVVFTNTGTSAAANAVQITSVSGGITLTTASNKDVSLTVSGTGAVVVAAGKTFKADTINQSTTNATTVTLANTGTSTDAGAVSISSTSGGISITGGAGQLVTINNDTLVDGYVSSTSVKTDSVIQGTTNLSSLSISNTGTSTSASAVAISSTTGGITLTAATNKDVLITTGGTGRLTNNSVAVPTISSTDTLTNKTMVGTANTIYRTTSRMKYTTTVATSIADSSLTYMPFATAAESTGRLSTEISVTGTNTRFGNNAGATRYWYVTCQMFTTGNTHVIVIDQFNSLDQLLNRFTTAVGNNTNDVAVSANGISMAQGDYIKCGIYHIGAGLTLYYSAGPPTIISALYISE